MSKSIQALMWAFVIIAMAFGARYGFVDGDAAKTLLIVMPLLAWLSISRRGHGCRPAKA